MRNKNNNRPFILVFFTEKLNITNVFICRISCYIFTRKKMLKKFLCFYMNTLNAIYLRKICSENNVV